MLRAVGETRAGAVEVVFADLFHRLAVLPLEIPPLRSRREDILPLAELFLARERERKAAPDDMVKAGLNSFLGELRQERERAAFNAWFISEYQNSGAADLAQKIGF